MSTSFLNLRRGNSGNSNNDGNGNGNDNNNSNGNNGDQSQGGSQFFTDTAPSSYALKFLEQQKILQEQQRRLEEEQRLQSYKLANNSSNNGYVNSSGDYTTTSATTSASGASGSSTLDHLTNQNQQPHHNLKTMEETAKQHFVIGDNLRHKAFYEEAIDEFQKAMHIQESLLGETSVVVARTHYSLGLALRASKEYPQALHHLAKAASIYESQGPDVVAKNHTTDILNCKLNIARTHHSSGVDFQRRGEYDRSILDHRKALAIRESLLGRSHVETARTYYVMGCALSDRGDFDEALAELRRALRTRYYLVALFSGLIYQKSLILKLAGSPCS